MKSNIVVLPLQVVQSLSLHPDQKNLSNKVDKFFCVVERIELPERSEDGSSHEYRDAQNFNFEETGYPDQKTYTLK